MGTTKTTKTNLAEKPSLTTKKSNYSHRTSGVAYRSEDGAKIMQIAIVRSIMENMGGKATLKEVQVGLRRMHMNIPQSTVAARMSDLREMGHVVFREEYKIYEGRERKVFEVLPAEERKDIKIKRKVKLNRVLRKRVRRGKKKGGILAVKKIKVITVKIKKLNLEAEKIKKEKIIRKPILPTGLVQSSFFD